VTLVQSLDPFVLLAHDPTITVEARRLQPPRWTAFASAVERAMPAVFVDEATMVARRGAEAVSRRGKDMWSDVFAEGHAGLVHQCSNGQEHENHGGCLSERNTVEALLGGFQEKAAYLGHTYRYSREGILSGSYDFELVAGIDCDTVIDILRTLREASRETFLAFVEEWATSAQLESLVALGQQQRVPQYKFLGRHLLKDYSLIAIESFTYEGSRERAPLAEVSRSPELAGILNNASWYRHYGEKYGEKLKERDIGYREDELYIPDRANTVVVLERFWTEDTLVLYYEDLKLLSHHCLSRLVLLSSILRVLQTDKLWNDPSGPRLEKLNALRSLYELIRRVDDSLDLGSLINQGFLRLLAGRILTELGIDKARSFVGSHAEDGARDLSLRDAIEAAQRSAATSALSNRLQAFGIAIAVIALVASLILGIAAVV
jgi:hypothetical protein